MFYVVEDLVAAGIREIGVIVSPEIGGEVKQALGSGERFGASFTYIVQEAPRGLAHAVNSAREFLESDPFVVYLGDNLLSGGIAHLVEEYSREGIETIVLLTPVDNPGQFGVAVLDGAGYVTRLVEKPQHPPSNLALVGVYLFGLGIFDIIATLEPSARGEYEITDAIQGVIDRRQRLVAHEVRGWWKDTGKPEDLLDANRLVLLHVERSIQGDVEGSRIAGAVVVEPGARIRKSIIRGPAHIAGGAVIEDSCVGPYTSVGERAQVIHSEVEYTILLHKAELYHLPYRLDSGVIGDGVVVDGRAAGPRKHNLQLVLGGRSHVKL